MRYFMVYWDKSMKCMNWRTCRAADAYREVVGLERDGCPVQEIAPYESDDEVGQFVRDFENHYGEEYLRDY